MARFVVLLLALMLPAAALAENNHLLEARSQTYSVAFRHPAVPEGRENGSAVNLVWDADLRMSLDGDAPVFSGRFRYMVEDWLYVLPALGPGDVQAWSSIAATGEKLPAEAPQVRPHDVKLMFRFYAPEQNSYIGVPIAFSQSAEEGEWVDIPPEYPGWSHAFVWLSGLNKGDFLSPDTARSVWDGELRVEGATITSADWSAADLMQYLAENNMRGRAVAVAEAINRLLDGAARSYGYEVEALREDPERYFSPAFRRGVPIALLRKLERLQNLPAELKQGDDTAYEQARDEADAIMALMAADNAAFIEEEGVTDENAAGEAGQ